LSLLLPLIAAFVYATGALLVKRAAELGVGVWRTAFVANVVCALCFQPLLMLGGTTHAHVWWQPLLVALCFVLGQWFTFISLDTGDVSVATPVLGLKILLVATFVTTFRGAELRWQLWVAAILATAGIALLNRRGGPAAHHQVGRTIVTAGLAATAFAVFDVLVQAWAPAWGVGRFLPISLGLSGVLSCVFVARFRAPLSAIPRRTWPWLLGGTVTMATQSVLFVYTVAEWGQAAAANVVYSSRGLWSVVLVWLFGHWVKSREQHLGGRVLAWRMAGATFMTAAIVLVFW
jgi:drug/metabolite transporter (DMT)-like permease